MDYSAAEKGDADAVKAFETRIGDKPWAETKIVPPAILASEDQALRVRTGKI